MKYFVKAALVTLTLLALAGCFQMDMLIKVNPDGSGTIEQTVLMKDDFIEQMKSMNQAFTPEGEEPEEFSLLNEEELKQSASTLGKGVKYVKATPIKKPGFEGYTAIYSYKDINDLNIDQNPGGEMPGNEAQEKSPEFITFKFKKGKTSELTINMPEEKAKREETSPENEAPEKMPTDPQQEKMMMEMMKEMMNGMRMSIGVEVNGKIEKTNATFRDGSKITLMDMDFDKLVESEKDFEKFAKANPGQMSDAKEMMKNIPGMKVETEKKVQVRFK